MKLVELPPTKPATKRLRVASLEEADRLLCAIPSLADRVVFAIAFYTGLRRGEISRLDWGDVDWEGRSLIVRKAKSSAGEYRRPPMPRMLVAPLREYHMACGRPSRGLICPGVLSGKLIGRVSRAWEAANKTKKAALGRDLEPEERLERITLHNCRHTYATWLMDAGHNIRQLQEWMGQQDLAATMRYLKLLPIKANANRAERLDAYLDARGQ